MLKKLLKYDLKNLFKSLLPIYLVTLVVTILTVILNNLSNKSNLFSTLNALMIFSYIIILMVLLIGTFFLSIRDFYLDFTSERAYLVNTLPVKKRTIIASKFITSLITMLASMVVMFISFLILIIGNGIWVSFAKEVSILLNTMTGEIWVLLILTTVLMIVMYIGILALCYFSISLGQLKNTNKLGFSFLAFIGIYIIYEIYFTISLSTIFVIDPNFIRALDATVTPIGSINVLMAIIIVLSLIFTAIITPITNYLLKNHLNLE